MEIKLYYTGKDSHKIKKEIEKFYSEVKKYFDFDLDELNVHIHKTRKDFDKYLNKKTELWNVANANSRSNRINILHPEAFEKESSHPKDDFPAIKEIIDVDGVRVIFEDGWGLVRASNTTPVLVTRFESTDEKKAKLYEEKLNSLIMQAQGLL